MAQNLENVLKHNTFCFDLQVFDKTQNFLSEHKVCTSIWNLF